MQMTPQRLKELLSKEEELDIIEEYEHTEENGTTIPCAIIANHKVKEVFEINYNDFCKNEDTEEVWQQIKAVFYKQRQPIVLKHMTRIVGYYSFIENWNNSKVGELEDRHKGSYAI